MSIVTLRYAHAFGDVARAGNIDERTAQLQLRDFADTFNGSPELQEFLMNPSIDVNDKLRIVDTLTDRIGVLPQVRNFIKVIMTHERLHDLNDILAEYATVVDVDTKITEANVTTARPLNDDDRKELETKIAGMAGGQVRTTYHEDSTLLGGAVVRIGSTVYDGSVRGQLQQMKQRLINA